MEIRKRKLRSTLFYLVLLCLLIGGISTYVYTRISHEVAGRGGGMFDFTTVFGSEDRSIRGIRAAVLRSGQTADYLAWVSENRADEIEKEDVVPVSPEETRENYYAMSDFWLEQLDAAEIRAELIDEATLGSPEEMERFNLLVLPATYCLSDAQVEAVKSFLVRRKSVVFTHFSGNRHEDGGDRPWSLLADVIGADLAHPSTDRLEENAARLIFAGNNPITADIAPGEVLPINTYDRPVAGNIRDDERTQTAAVWPNAANFLPIETNENAAVAYGTYRGGRFVWFGFTAQSVRSGPRHWPHFQKLIENSLYWAGRQPTVGRSAWPESYAAAATVGVMARDAFFETSATERMLAQSGIPYARYVPADGTQVIPSGSIRNRDTVETGLYFGNGFATSTLDEEAISDLNARGREFEDRWDVDVTGLALGRTPDNLFEPSENLKFEYLWLPERRRFVPQQVPFGRGTSRPFFSRTPPQLTVMGQSARSDRHLVESLRMTEPGRFAEGLVRDLRRVRNIGGLYAIALHPEFMNPFVGEEELGAWTDALAASDIWKATPREIADWWKRYAKVKLQIGQEGGRFTLRMSNEGNRKVPAIRVFIYPGVLPETLEIRAERMRTPIPDYRIRSARNRIELFVSDLDEQENRTYYIDF